MEILKQSRDFTKQEVYKLTRGQSINAKDAVGTTVPVDAYCMYSEVNSKGEQVEILAILSKDDGTVYATMSNTFKREFEYIAEIMDGDPFSILIIGGQTKGGREFVSCTLA